MSLIKEKKSYINNKMANKYLSITLLLATLVFGMGIVSIQSVQASPAYSLSATGSAIAEWTTADKYTGSYSVKLTTITTGDYAGVSMDYNGKIDSITSLSFWYKDVSFNSWSGPRIAISMVDGGLNYLAVSACAIDSFSWKRTDAVNGLKNVDWYTTGTGSQIWWYGTWDGSNQASYSQIGGPITFSTLKTTLSGADLKSIAVYLGVVTPGFVGAGSAYIDEFEVNSVTYDLELPHPVGGILTPVNKLAILGPYLALLGLVGVLSMFVTIRRRRKT